MPRWFALCNGAGIATCSGCRRLAALYPVEASERNQAFVMPDLQGEHCFHFLERPPHHLAPIEPIPTAPTPGIGTSTP